MKKDVNTINNTRSSVSYCFDSAELSVEKDKVISEYCSTVAIPGFRKGKTSKNVILSKFSSDIESRVKSILLNKAFEDAQKSEKELNLLAVVDFSTENVEDRFVCKLIFDIRPEIELPDYKNISLTPFSVDVSNEEIESEFERIKRQYAKYEIVDRAVQAGDYVKVNYNGVLEDGSEIVTVVPDHKIWGKQSNTWEEAGNAEVQGVQAVIQGVIGHKVGDKDESEEIFAEDFSIPELAGKKATYSFEILEIRERVDPEINEEFLRQYGVSSVGELEDKIKKHLTQYNRTQGLVKQRDEIVNFLADHAQFELPESVLQNETQTLVQTFIDAQAKNGIPAKNFESRIDEISKSLLPMAGIRGKSGLILDKIAEVEKITIDNKDIESMIWQDTMMKKVNVNQYINKLKKNRNVLLDLRTRALRGKVLDFLIKTNSKEIVEANEIQQENLA